MGGRKIRVGRWTAILFSSPVQQCSTQAEGRPWDSDEGSMPGWYFFSICHRGIKAPLAGMKRSPPLVSDSPLPRLFAQRPFEAPNGPKPPQTPNFPENLALPWNPPRIPTDFILSAIQNHTEFRWVPLNFSEISRSPPTSPQFHRIPWNFRGDRGGEEFT